MTGHINIYLNLVLADPQGPSMLFLTSQIINIICHTITLNIKLTNERRVVD